MEPQRGSTTPSSAGIDSFNRSRPLQTQTSSKGDTTTGLERDIQSRMHVAALSNTHQDIGRHLLLAQTLPQNATKNGLPKNMQSRLPAVAQNNSFKIAQNIGQEILVGGVQSQAELFRNREVLHHLIQYSRKEDRSVTVELGSEKYSLWCSLDKRSIELKSEKSSVYSIHLNSEYGITSIRPLSLHRSSPNLRLVKNLISLVDLEYYGRRSWLPEGVPAQPSAEDLCSLNNTLKIVGWPIEGAISGGDYDYSYYKISQQAPDNIRIEIFGFNGITLVVEMDVDMYGSIEKLSIDEMEVSDIFSTIPPICVLLTMHESKRKKLGDLKAPSIFLPYTRSDLKQDDPQRTSPFWRVLEMFQPQKEQSAEKSLAQEALQATTVAALMKSLVQLRSLCMESSFNSKVFLALIHAWPMQDEVVKVVAGKHTCEIPLIFLYAQIGILAESSGLGFKKDEFIICVQVEGEKDQLEVDCLNCIKNMSSAGVLSHENVMGLLVFAIDYKVTWLLNDCAKFLTEFYRDQNKGQELAEFLINLGVARAFDPEVLSKLIHPFAASLKTREEIAAFFQSLDLAIHDDADDKAKLGILKNLVGFQTLNINN